MEEQKRGTSHRKRKQPEQPEQPNTTDDSPAQASTKHVAKKHKIGMPSCFRPCPLFFFFSFFFAPLSSYLLIFLSSASGHPHSRPETTAGDADIICLDGTLSRGMISFLLDLCLVLAFPSFSSVVFFLHVQTLLPCLLPAPPRLPLLCR
jgi:hypothetical protein